MKRKKMKKNSLVKRRLYVCPKCNGDNVDTSDYEMDEEHICLQQFCTDCETSWIDYALVSYAGCTYNERRYDKKGKERD